MNFIFNKTFLASLLVPFIAGLFGGVAGYYAIPQIDNLVTKYIFVSKTDQKNVEQLNPENKIANFDELNNLNNNKQDNTSSELSITEVVEKVSPSVVSVIVSKEVLARRNDFFYELFPFGLPFNIEQPNNPSTGNKQQVGGGTGFIISNDGLILTNKHVVTDTSASYSIVMNNGKSYEATVIDRDPLNDLAVLKIQADNLPAVKLGDSSKIKVGQSVVAIGYALGEYSNSVTKGIVSGLGRDVVAGDGSGSSESLQGVIQTDAAINPGNSGGPLLNLYGEVIGINTAVNRSGQLVGFSIPINMAKPVISSVIKNGKIIRPYMGVRYVMLNKEIADKNGLSVTEGALIVGDNSQLAILPNSPASKAGLKEGDVIISINDVVINDKKSLASLIAEYQPGQTIKLKIIRENNEQEINVVLAEMKTSN